MIEQPITDHARSGDAVRGLFDFRLHAMSERIERGAIVIEIPFGVLPCPDQQRGLVEGKVIPCDDLREPGQPRARFHAIEFSIS